MAKLPDIERRLLNWARWRLRNMGTGGNFATTRWDEERVDGGGYDAPTVIGTNDAEAEVMQQAVMALPSHLRATVEAVYLGNGTQQQKAWRLCISLPTIHSRVDQAHRRLAGWLTERASQQRSQRERMEALQASARPGGFGLYGK